MEKIYLNYPNLYWFVKVKDAKKSVTIKGKVADAIKGMPGETMACHLAYASQRNADAFPHGCYLASFKRTVAHVVSKIKNGKPSEAVRYLHSYAKLVDLNDRKLDNNFIEKHPEMFDRPFTLRPWQKQVRRGGVATGKGEKRVSSNTAYGAKRRAVEAGLISNGVADAITK